MNEAPSPPEQDATIDIIAIVTRASDGACLLIEDGQAGRLPRFRLRRDDFRAAPPLNNALAGQFGLQTTVLRCLLQGRSDRTELKYRAYVLEQHGNDPPPGGAAWVRREDLESRTISSKSDRRALAAWLAGLEGERDQRCAWAEAGWWDGAVGWIDQELARLNIERTGPMEQLRVWSLSSVIRTPSSQGDTFFKAVPPFMAQEGPAMAAISQQHPSMLPPLLAADGERGWILMPDFGGRWLGVVPEVEEWEAAVSMQARMQVEQAEHTGVWMRMGVPDRSIRRMVDLIDPLITVSSRMLAGREDGLSDEEVEALQGLSMRLKFMCAHLADFKVPHSLLHGDLGGNIIIKDDGGFVFFDWTDVCVSHPFFDMTTVSSTVFDDNPFAGDEAIDQRLRDAYLEPWLKYEPMDRLVQAYDVSRPLGALHQAMSYMWILTNISEDARWELEDGLLQWIRALLRLCGRQ